MSQGMVGQQKARRAAGVVSNAIRSYPTSMACPLYFYSWLFVSILSLSRPLHCALQLWALQEAAVDLARPVQVFFPAHSSLCPLYACRS